MSSQNQEKEVHYLDVAIYGDKQTGKKSLLLSLMGNSKFKT